MMAAPLPDRSIYVAKQHMQLEPALQKSDIDTTPAIFYNIVRSLVSRRGKD